MGYLSDVKFGKRALTKEENLNEAQTKQTPWALFVLELGPRRSWVAAACF